MDEPQRTAVTVVTGFLGAGKTTLVNAWLGQHEPGELAVIVNELGVVGIDGALLRTGEAAARARAIVEITGGCICCTTYGELVRALRALSLETPAPRRILVETSGAASPAGVLRAISRSEGLALEGVITVVDATRLAQLTRHDLAVEQVAYADVVVLSRADVCDAATMQEAAASLARRNGVAAIVTAARGALTEPAGATLDALLALRRADLPGPRIVPSTHDAASSAGGGGASAIESLSLSLDGELDEERFGAWVESELAAFEGRLLRTKGVLAIAGLDERLVLQGVADAIEVELGAPWEDAPRVSRLVIVGFGLDGEALSAGFAACAA
jgi:G3E family GTPase